MCSVVYKCATSVQTGELVLFSPHDMICLPFTLGLNSHFIVLAYLTMPQPHCDKRGVYTHHRKTVCSLSNESQRLILRPRALRWNQDAAKADETLSQCNIVTISGAH